MKNNKITNNFLKKVVGPDNSDNVKKIIRKLESGVETEDELYEKINQKNLRIQEIRVEQIEKDIEDAKRAAEEIKIAKAAIAIIML